MKSWSRADPSAMTTQKWQGESISYILIYLFMYLFIFIFIHLVFKICFFPSWLEKKLHIACKDKMYIYLYILFYIFLANKYHMLCWAYFVT